MKLIAAILAHPQGGQFLQHLLMMHQRSQGQQGGNQGGGMYGQPPMWGGNPPQPPQVNAIPGNPGAQGPWGNLSGANNLNEGGGTSNLLPGMRRGEPGGPMGMQSPSASFYANPGLNGMAMGGGAPGDPSNGLSSLGASTAYPSTANNSYAAGSTQYDFGMYGGGMGPQGRMW